MAERICKSTRLKLMRRIIKVNKSIKLVIINKKVKFLEIKNLGGNFSNKFCPGRQSFIYKKFW